MVPNDGRSKRKVRSKSSGDDPTPNELVEVAVRKRGRPPSKNQTNFLKRVRLDKEHSQNSLVNVLNSEILPNNASDVEINEIELNVENERNSNKLVCNNMHANIVSYDMNMKNKLRNEEIKEMKKSS